MKNIINKIALSFLLLLVFVINLNAQCYQVKAENTGLNLEEVITDLEPISCSLDSLVEASLNIDFSIMDVGFYTNVSYFEGGNDEEFQRIVNELSLPDKYHLIIGKGSSSDKAYSNFYVDLKLPENSDFSCYDVEFINTSIKALINSSGNGFDQYQFFATKVLKKVFQSLDYQLNCCDTSNKSTGCFCEAEMLTDFLEGNGFDYLSTAELTYDNSYDHISFDGYSPEGLGVKTIDYDGNDYHFLNELDETVDSIKFFQGTTSVKLHYVDEYTICQSLNNAEPVTKSLVELESNFNEEIYIINIPGKELRVYYKNYIYLDSGNKSLGGTPKWFKKALDRMMKASPSGALGTAVQSVMDYALTATFMFWFPDQGLSYNGWIDALLDLGERRGIIGGLFVVWNSWNNSIASDLITGIVDYFLITPVNDITAKSFFINVAVTVLGSFGSDIVQFSKSGAKFMGDVLTDHKFFTYLTANLFTEGFQVFLTKVKAWDILFSNSAIRKQVGSLESVTEYLDDFPDRGPLLKSLFDDADDLEQVYPGTIKKLANDNEAVVLDADLSLGFDVDTKKAVDWLTPEPGWYDVVIHGKPDYFEVWTGKDLVEINHRDLANYMNSQGYSGGKVRLVSCQTGVFPDAIGQHLSNKLGVEVIAPKANINVFPDGSYTIDGDAGWRNFIPGTIP